MVSRRQFLALGSASAVALVTHADDPFSWERLRADFDLDPALTYLNTGTLGAVPRRVREARSRAEFGFGQDPTRFQGTASALDAPRRAIAALVNAGEDEIAITRSTTEGLNLFASGLDLRRGDEVIVGLEEHNAALTQYHALARRTGVRLVRADIEASAAAADTDRFIDAYRKAITPRSRVILASHVTYRSGTTLPIRALSDLAHSRGLLISVDGAQAFGVLPLDLPALDADHYAAPGHKWLLAGTGTGFSWVRRDVQSRVRPVLGDYDPASGTAADHTARRYERTGQRDVADLTGLREALTLHETVGIARISQRITALATQLRAGLQTLDFVRIHTPPGVGASSGITSFSVDGLSPTAIGEALRERRVIVRVLPHGKDTAIRVSTHVYNTGADMEKLVGSLREFSRDRSGRFAA